MWSKTQRFLSTLLAAAVLVISGKWCFNDPANPEAQLGLLGAIIVVVGGVVWRGNKSKAGVSDLLTVSYMRLFGAVEVPLLMKMVGHQGPFPPFDEMPYRKGPDGSPISEEMCDFWKKQWVFKDAMPVLNDIWSTYCGNRWQGVNLYFNSLRPTSEDLLTFSSCIEVDAACCLAPEVAEFHELKYDEEWYPDGGTGTKPCNIAFLFVILQNNTGVTLEDLEFELKAYKNPLELRAYQSKHLFTPLHEWPNPEHEALTDQLIDLAAPVTESKKIALLHRGGSLIIALSAYKANQDGFPDFYLTDVTVPVGVSATIKGIRVSQKIRKPFLDKAAKVLVPNGWFHQ
jgi:hypothetical protein